MHSSRAAFSSLHTQQGFTFVVASPPDGLRSDARLFVVIGCSEDESELVVIVKW